MNRYPNNFTSRLNPTCLDDFVISDQTSRNQLEAVVNGQLPFPLFDSNGICLWGINGTGKSTLALLLPQLLEQSAKLLGSQRACNLFISDNYWDVTECAIGNNSTTTLIDLNSRCKSNYATSPSGWHYEILDEVDLLSERAQASLKAAMSFANSTIFILTTNHLSKLDKGILDRCILVEMNMAELEEYERLSLRLLNKMSAKTSSIPNSLIANIAKSSRGSIRQLGKAVAALGMKYGGVI